MDVVVLPGFSASEPLFDSRQQGLVGVATQDVGLLKDGSAGPNFERGTEVLGRQTILVEGARGSLSERVMEHFQLREHCDAQIYGLGFKEVWRVAADNEHYSAGRVVHALGYPVPSDVYGGSFVYHAAERQVLVGCVVGLEYANPYLSPYAVFQSLKLHPDVAKLLRGGECLSYGARVINEGGFQSVPRLSFPGGVLAGCAAGFVNVPKVKGSHYAIKSGMLAAESLFAKLAEQEQQPLEELAAFL